MKIFISYKFAGEDKETIRELMKKIKLTLGKSNHEMFTTFLDEEEFKKNNATMRQIMDKALNYIDKADLVLCLVKAPDTSLGMNFEIGYTVAKKKKMILAIEKNIQTRWIEHYADKIIKFSDLEDLYKKLEKI
jgi:nucleoside 2-deoxyribosyltransferase